jgi:hypothetical protein
VASHLVDSGALSEAAEGKDTQREICFSSFTLSTLVLLTMSWLKGCRL